MKRPFTLPRWVAPRRAKRLCILLAMLVAVYAWDQWRRWWRPTQHLTTAHYAIASSATAAQTKDMAERAEALYQAYVAFAGHDLALPPDSGRHTLKLFRDRREFRTCNRVTSWAEAFCSPAQRCCCAYYPTAEISPYHWMLHEATHQLNHEVAQLDLPRWLDEGIADYFGTSAFVRGTIRLGEPDVNTYPLWWLSEMKLSGDETADAKAVQFIPLRTIVEERGGPDIDKYFNLYYIHWWSLTHFLLHGEHGKYRQGFFRMLKEGGSPASFEKQIGPFERVQPEWYRYLCEQRKRLG